MKLRVYEPKELEELFLVNEMIENWEQIYPTAKDKAVAEFKKQYEQSLEIYKQLMVKIMDPEYGK